MTRRESLAVTWRRAAEHHPELRALVPEELGASGLLDAVEQALLRHRPVSVAEMFGRARPFPYLPEQPGRGWRPRWCLACAEEPDGTRPLWPCPPLRALTGALHRACGERRRSPAAGGPDRSPPKHTGGGE